MALSPRFARAMAQEIEQLIGAHRADELRAFEDALRQLALAIVKREHGLFDRIFGHDADDRNGLDAAKAMGPIARLILGGRIPPRIEVDHIIRRREVQARPARLERDEEEGRFMALESLHEAFALALRRRTIEIKRGRSEE